MTPAQAGRWHPRHSGGVTLWVTYGPDPGTPIAVIANDPRDTPPDLYLIRVVCAPGNVAKRATLECSGSPFDEVVNEAEGLIRDCGWDLGENEARPKKKG